MNQMKNQKLTHKIEYWFMDWFDGAKSELI